MTALIAARRIQIQLPMIAATSLASLAACWWLVPIYGMHGAAWSLAASKLPYLAVGLWMIAKMRPDAGRVLNVPATIPSIGGSNTKHWHVENVPHERKGAA